MHFTSTFKHELTTENILIKQTHCLYENVCASEIAGKLQNMKSTFHFHTRQAAIENALYNRRTRIKIARNSVFNFHLSPTGDKWQSKTMFLTIFDLRPSIVLTFSIADYTV